MAHHSDTHMDNQQIRERIEAAFPGVAREWEDVRGDLKMHLPPEHLVTVATWLRDDEDLHYAFLENLCGVDYLGRTPRFEVVYHLFSFKTFHRLCLKVGVPEATPTVPSVVGVWVTANWHERETYDMFGIMFEGHPSLQRILMPEDWIGHPLRKDVPLGYEEVAFTFNQEQIYADKPFARE